MKRFLAIYTGTPDAMASWSSLSEHERQERQTAGVKAWHAWAEKNKASIIEMGAPLGRTKSVSKGGVTDIRNNMTAFTVVQAETHEAAARLFENHPHFTIFPGDAIEVMECLPIPKM
jgi:hemolysin-activating ACP:hemolysin acyltransferase